ncbi:SDR family oxidoreductase [Candidatus Kapabacteria bacterium]|nr:SDR family oxidoreductase [Candidatus Kapabacteria bacterium]
MNKIKKILIFGASSKIAQETAKNFNQEGTQLYLAGSNLQKLEIVRDDLKVRSPKATFYLEQINALEFDKHNQLIENAKTKMDGLDCVLIAHGTLPENDEIRKDHIKTLHHFNINCTSVISLSTIAATNFEKQGYGTLAVISSVAGERGRQSNYIYGSAKGGVSLFLQGLRNRLINSNVNILTIKPGPTDTPMTTNMKKGLLFAKADAVGKSIHSAILNGKDVLYTPWFWRYIMAIIKAVPESIFKKMSM